MWTKPKIETHIAKFCTTGAWARWGKQNKNKSPQKALSTCPKRSLRSQWDNGQARHSLNLSLPYVVAYCLTEISAFSQAMWTKPSTENKWFVPRNINFDNPKNIWTGKCLNGNIFSGIQVRFVTNETQKTRRQIQAKLHQHGFTMKEEEMWALLEILIYIFVSIMKSHSHVIQYFSFPPALAMAKIAKDQGLTPHFLVHPEVMPDFAGVSDRYFHIEA